MQPHPKKCNLDSVPPVWEPRGGEERGEGTGDVGRHRADLVVLTPLSETVNNSPKLPRKLVSVRLSRHGPLRIRMSRLGRYYLAEHWT